MKALWQAWFDHLSDETCDQIVKEANKLPSQAGVIGDNTVNTDVRDAEIRWIPRDNKEFKELWGTVDDYFEWANMNAFGVDTRFSEYMQFTTYNAQRKGHYTWHSDVFWESNNVYDRKLSMVIQLSHPEEYVGGELELDVQNGPDPELLKKRGSIIVFPSFLHHRVLPVVSGKRNSLVIWKNGPSWR
jgi:PKHD-type hydroxylase